LGQLVSNTYSRPSISPDNEPSLRLAQQFGFRQVGEQMDEIDGLEYVFETSWPKQG